MYRLLPVRFARFSRVKWTDRHAALGGLSVTITELEQGAREPSRHGPFADGVQASQKNLDVSRERGIEFWTRDVALVGGVALAGKNVTALGGQRPPEPKAILSDLGGDAVERMLARRDR